MTTNVFEVFDLLIHILSFIGFPQLSKFGTLNSIWFDAIKHLYSRKLQTSYESEWFFVDCELKNLSQKQKQLNNENEIIHGYLTFLIKKGIRIMITEINKMIYMHIKSNYDNSYFCEIFHGDDYCLVGYHPFSDQVLIIHTIKKSARNTRVDFIFDFCDFPTIKTRTKTIDIQTSFAHSLSNTACSMCSDKFLAQLTFSNGTIDLDCVVIDAHVFRIYNIFDSNSITNIYCNNIIHRINFFDNKYILCIISDVSQNYRTFWEIIEIIGENNFKQTRLSQTCQEMLNGCYIEDIHKIEYYHFLISVKVGSLMSKISNKLFHLFKTKENWEIVPIKLSTYIKTIFPFKCPFSKKLYLLQENQMFQKVQVHYVNHIIK